MGPQENSEQLITILREKAELHGFMSYLCGILGL